MLEAATQISDEDQSDSPLPDYFQDAQDLYGITFQLNYCTRSVYKIFSIFCIKINQRILLLVLLDKLLLVNLTVLAARIR